MRNVLSKPSLFSYLQIQHGWHTFDYQSQEKANGFNTQNGYRSRRQRAKHGVWKGSYTKLYCIIFFKRFVKKQGVINYGL